ncbi:hypothetical protein [Nocardia sp. AB354]|uniref:hypothetical protein n=1 Tax=Nocardia sp. AB354 TaxID=3413283 RepID=UPI003C1B30E2
MSTDLTPAMFDGSDTDEADAMLVAALADLTALRRDTPGKDITSRCSGIRPDSTTPR